MRASFFLLHVATAFSSLFVCVGRSDPAAAYVLNIRDRHQGNMVVVAGKRLANIDFGWLDEVSRQRIASRLCSSFY